MPYIRYLIKFQEEELKALINFDNKVNVMTSAYTIKLGLTIQKTSIGAQKIDGSLPKIYSMPSANFLHQDKLERVWFFEETFLLANTSIKKVLRILFFSFSNIDVKFAKLRKFT